MASFNSLDELIAALRRFKVQIVDFLEETPEIFGEGYAVEFKRALDEKRSPGGKTHAALRPRSMYPRKRTRDPGNHVLKDKLHLNESFKFKKNRWGRGHTSVTMEVNPVDTRGRMYAPYHQEGTRRMAQRVVLEESAEGEKRDVRPKLKRRVSGLNELLDTADWDALIDDMTTPVP